jgi:hypothetical protein
VRELPLIVLLFREKVLEGLFKAPREGIRRKKKKNHA